MRHKAILRSAAESPPEFSCCDKSRTDMAELAGVELIVDPSVISTMEGSHCYFCKAPTGDLKMIAVVEQHFTSLKVERVSVTRIWIDEDPL